MCADLSVCVCVVVYNCVFCVNLMKLFPCYSVLHVGTLAGLPRAPWTGLQGKIVCVPI